MKIIQIILLSFAFLTSFSQNKRFLLPVGKDSIIVERIDTAFLYRTDEYEIQYESGDLCVVGIIGGDKVSFKSKIAGIITDSVHELPVADIVLNGYITFVDTTTGVVIEEGEFVNGKKVGVWHLRTYDNDFLTVYDSVGQELPLFEYEIDTLKQKIFVNHIDTVTFRYYLGDEINLNVDPVIYFRKESDFFDSNDTVRFCILNRYFDSVGYKLWKNIDSDFIRFTWFREMNPINLNIVETESAVLLSLLVTDAKFDFEFGNIVQKKTTEVSERKKFVPIEKQLEKMNFWAQVSKDVCFGDYLFVEAKMRGKYNSKRINCSQYKLQENRKIMKLFRMLSEKAGLEKEFEIKY